MRTTFEHFAASGLVAALCAGVGGCAGGGDYPSLALRPFETATTPIAAPPAPEPIRSPVSPALVETLRHDAATSHAAFLEQEPVAARLVRGAAGQSFETNARAGALVALADLDARRGATSAALGSLDALAAEAALALAADPALDSAQAETAALLARQDAAIARLWETLGS